jgi:hypothetical protein
MSSIYKLWWVALGGVVVNALATGLKIRWFKPGHGRWILRAKKNFVARLTSKESKAVGPMSEDFTTC